MRCSTIGCTREAGTHELQWNYEPNEPVCDPCARFYAAMNSTDFAVIDTTEVPA